MKILLARAVTSNVNAPKLRATSDADQALLAITLALVFVLTVPVKMAKGMELAVTLGGTRIRALPRLVLAK